MADIINVGKMAMDVRKAPTVLPYSKVIINVAKEDNSVVSYIADGSDDSGLTLEIDCPWGTQQVANDMLAKVRGYQYQPYTVTTALVDPATEMGDAVQTNGVYGGIYQQDSDFTHTFFSDFSAPQDEEVDHEFTFESPIERRLSRQEAYARATFSIQHDNIEAKVSQKSGDIEKNSFAWRLLSDHFSLYSGTKEVFKCISSGIMVDGEIKARTGYIGDDSSGFTINKNSIFNGKNGIGVASGSQKNGVYLGTDGIALGTVTYDGTKYDAFSVTSNGQFIARTGYIGNGSSGFTINNKSIFNGTDSLVSTTQGTYLGIDGIRIYNTATENFTFNKNGTLAINKGMTGITDTTHTSGMHIGNDGIVLGGGKFKVTSSGALTAQSGTIGSGTEPWNIGNSGIYRGKKSYGAKNSGIFIGNSGISMGAAQKKTVYSYASSNNFPQSADQLNRNAIYHANDTGANWYWDGNWHNLGTGDNDALYLNTAPFKVDSNGNLTAYSGNFYGSVYVGSLRFTDKDGKTVTIDASNLTDGSIKTAKIGDTQITGAKIGTGQVSKTHATTALENDINKGIEAKDQIDDLMAGRITSTYLVATDGQINTFQTVNLKVQKSGSTYQKASWKDSKTFVKSVNFTNQTVETDTISSYLGN